MIVVVADVKVGLSAACGKFDDDIKSSKSYIPLEMFTLNIGVTDTKMSK